MSTVAILFGKESLKVCLARTRGQGGVGRIGHHEFEKILFRKNFLAGRTVGVLIEVIERAFLEIMKRCMNERLDG